MFINFMWRRQGAKEEAKRLRVEEQERVKRERASGVTVPNDKWIVYDNEPALSGAEPMRIECFTENSAILKCRRMNIEEGVIGRYGYREEGV